MKKTGLGPEAQSGSEVVKGFPVCSLYKIALLSFLSSCEQFAYFQGKLSHPSWYEIFAKCGHRAVPRSNREHVTNVNFETFVLAPF